MDLSHASFRSLYQSAHKRLKEDFAAQTAQAISAETNCVLDLEAAKLLAQVTLIVNGNASPVDKIGELVSLLIEYDDDEDEDDDVTDVTTRPTTR